MGAVPDYKCPQSSFTVVTECAQGMIPICSNPLFLVRLENTVHQRRGVRVVYRIYTAKPSKQVRYLNTAQLSVR